MEKSCLSVLFSAILARYTLLIPHIFNSMCLNLSPHAANWNLCAIENPFCTLFEERAYFLNFLSCAVYIYMPCCRRCRHCGGSELYLWWREFLNTTRHIISSHESAQIGGNFSHSITFSFKHTQILWWWWQRVLYFLRDVGERNWILSTLPTCI